ncbi:putative RNA-binding protein [Trypanosoma grayi]|uniref:putative RNA-binding protein n=1 Tax=Trypanosoma grayi TaxID=71804 RepID=UPI0004F43909|nr:putative RNA-binding protein [Trypanosoma grayi]KEG09328.1 putative RNA-binding protein [Trypanosoma grayi]
MLLAEHNSDASEEQPIVTSSVKSKNTQSSSGCMTNVDSVSTSGDARDYDKPFRRVHDDSVFDENDASCDGGLYMEDCMNFVIATDGNDDDASPAMMAAMSLSDPASTEINILGTPTPGRRRRVADDVPSALQRPQDYTLPFGYGGTNSDALFSYTNWQRHEGNGSTNGDLSPAASSSVGPAADSNLQQSQHQPQVGGLPEESTTENSGMCPQTKQPLDDEVRSNLFISGLHPSVTDSELHGLFSPYGTIESAKVMLDIHTGKSRGIAFVKFADVASAEKALEALNNSLHLGETLAVRVAKPHAAYRPGAPTNKTFVRNVPLGVKKSDLAQHFGRYGDVVDVSIHSDTAQRVLNKRRNVAFITYTTKEAAAKAAQETHTTTPFPDCDGIPLLAKVAEDSAHRIERLARRGACRHANGSLKNSISSASACSSLQGPPPGFPLAAVSQKGMEQFASASAPSYPFAPSLSQPILTDPFGTSASAPAFYTAPFFPMPPAAGSGSAPFFFVGSDSNSAIFAPPVAAPFGGAMRTTNKSAENVCSNNNNASSASSPPPPPMVMYAPGHPAMMAPQPAVMYYLPNGTMAMAAAHPQPSK